ncbi:hypothetical protein LWC34_50395 [Kibdelosporangium philippinense]|uniref:Uncharacterized protein n=2 Tax=Kibdelosporangium philippinense TaxID=211113 RepID=A0ABS8ZUP9_9PSEU|nr:hypothetical protein [Kibdelosporangium philippinense]MCE7010963.1 hypothetical protein [Kibdelosporangium philippinense]
MLAGLTPWGYTRFWWVTVKIVLALGCALGGRATFGRWLATAARQPIPSDALIWGAVLMIAAIAFMAWVARAKPWGQIGHNRQPVQPWDHPALWVIVLGAPVADYVTDLPPQAIPAALVLGHHALLTRRPADGVSG